MRMIKTRKDLKFYIEEDAKRNDIKPGVFWYISHLLYASDHLNEYRYLKCLRHCEYHKNNRGFYHSVLYAFWRLLKSRIGSRYFISIPENVCGYGLRILHLSGGGDFD